MSPQAKLYGTDIDPEAIEWLNENYQKFGTFSRNPIFHRSHSGTMRSI
jgi:methylase of polypeptide subunit release factors